MPAVGVYLLDINVNRLTICCLVFLRRLAQALMQVQPLGLVLVERERRLEQQLVQERQQGGADKEGFEVVRRPERKPVDGVVLELVRRLERNPVDGEDLVGLELVLVPQLERLEV